MHILEGLQGDQYVSERFQEVIVRSWIDSDKIFFTKKKCLGIQLLKVMKHIFYKIHHNLATASGLFFMNSNNYGMCITLKNRKIHYFNISAPICFKFAINLYFTQIKKPEKDRGHGSTGLDATSTVQGLMATLYMGTHAYHMKTFNFSKKP